MLFFFKNKCRIFLLGSHRYSTAQRKLRPVFCVQDVLCRTLVGAEFVDAGKVVAVHVAVAVAVPAVPTHVPAYSLLGTRPVGQTGLVICEERIRYEHEGSLKSCFHFNKFARNISFCSIYYIKKNYKLTT